MIHHELKALLFLTFQYVFQNGNRDSVWDYIVEWYPGGTTRQKSAIVVTSEPRSIGTDFDIEVWTNSEVASDIVTSQHPLAVFAKITKGSSAVMEAKVEVKVVVSTTNGTVDSQVFRLLDNGNGGNYTFYTV